MPITQDLLDRCYATLERCYQFDSLDNLRTVFNSNELSPFRDHLPDDSSRAKRIRQTVDYLLYQRISDNRPVFPLFLKALRPSKPGDVLYTDLDTLSDEFQRGLEQGSCVSVPYVVAAMKRQEAESLQNGAAFQGPKIAPIDRDRFNELLPQLPEHWMENYGTGREEWKLHADHSSVIGLVLNEMFEHINFCLGQPQNLQIDKKPLSEAFFSPEQQVEVWRELQQSGGLLIVDAISLFYPPILKALKDSALLSNEHIAVLVLSPLDFYVMPVNRHIIELIKEEMAVAYSRFEELDHRYEMGIGDRSGIKRWLFTLFSKPENMAETIKNRRADSNRGRMRRQSTRDGMPNVIFRQSEA